MDPELKQTLDAMQRTLAALEARVAALENGNVEAREAAADGPVIVPVAAGAPWAAAPPAESAEHPHRRSDDEIAPEIVLAISAAVAAFLGERAHVRQIRLISSLAWGQQGRVNVQASHTLHR